MQATIFRSVADQSLFSLSSCLFKNSPSLAEDIFEELDKYGEIENLNICDNLADHMVGSVYAKFKDENDAAKAMQVCPQPSTFHGTASPMNCS